MDNCNLTFLNFESIIDSSFWHKYYSIKLEDDMLDEKIWPLRGGYLNTDSNSILLDYTSFQGTTSDPKVLCLKNLSNDQLKFTSPISGMLGELINLNTLEKFKTTDKNNFIKAKGQEIRKLIESRETLNTPSLINTFAVISFADLKNYEFYYWFCFPALSSLKYEIISKPKLLKEEFQYSQIDSLLKSHASVRETSRECFSAELVGNDLLCRNLDYFVESTSEENPLYLCIIDPSTLEFVPGWPLKNILALIFYHRKVARPISIICLRPGIKFDTSFIVTVSIEGNINEEKWVGWEKNSRDKYGPRSVNLKSNIDPLRLAESSVDLNLKLMKWRLVRGIDLETIKHKKCLLLGAGTLGCAVARCLMGWGVRNITFVDNGKISFSNPVRQSLYNYEDCDLGKGSKFKATAAADSLKRIFPSMIASGIIMDIPIVGNSTSTVHDSNVLHKLIEDNDVTFLLTDNRESRYLPTLICSVLNKLAITVALGFDSYLAIRHGLGNASEKLGCYFCNDVTAPRNSGDRTLDQQCTVTRPGASFMAASVAVELFMSHIQLKDGEKESILGVVPHSIRGFLSTFEQITINVSAFQQCIACSQKVKENYQRGGDNFLLNIFQSVKYLEELVGLDELQKLSEMAEILELSDDDSES